MVSADSHDGYAREHQEFSARNRWWQELADAIDEVVPPFCNLCDCVRSVNPLVQLRRPVPPDREWRRRVDARMQETGEKIWKARGLAVQVASRLRVTKHNGDEIQADLLRRLHRTSNVRSAIHELIVQNDVGARTTETRDSIKIMKTEILESLHEVSEKLYYISDPPETQAVADSSPASSSTYELLCYLANLPGGMIPVAELPEHFLDPDLLTVAYADRQIEFGHRQSFIDSDGELRVVEDDWHWSNLPPEKCKPMGDFTAEVKSYADDERLRAHVRLAAQGRIRVSRLKVPRPAIVTETKPLAMKTETKPPAIKTDRHVVQHRLFELCDSGEPYTDYRDLADRIGCGKTIIGTVIKASTRLKRWKERHTKAKGLPRASGLNEVIADNFPQTAEADPSDVLTDEDIDNVMRQVIEEAGPEERGRLHELSEDERRRLAKVFYQQNRDQEPSPAGRRRPWRAGPQGDPAQTSVT